MPLDLNGDGLQDLFWDKPDVDGRSTGTRAIWFNNRQGGAYAPDLLTKITDGLGATIEIFPGMLTSTPHQ